MKRVLAILNSVDTAQSVLTCSRLLTARLRDAELTLFTLGQP